MTWRRLLRIAVLTVCAFGIFGASPAWAEPVLIDGTAPAEGDVIPASPTELLLVFSEQLASPPTLTMAEQSTGLPVTTIGAAAQGDSADQWIVPLTAPLPNGTYRVTWVAGPSSGNYTFIIGAAATPTVVPGAVDSTGSTVAGAPTDTGVATPGATTPASSTSPTTKEASSEIGLPGILGRWMSSLGIAALVGALILIAFTWPEGVEYALTITYMRVVWVVSMIGTLMVVVAERAAMSGETFATSLSPGTWSDLTDTKPGIALLARLVFVAGCGWVAFGPERAIDATTQIPAFAAPALTLLTFGFARPIEGGLGALMVPAGVVHAVSVAAWFGGLALLTRVVLAGPGDEDLVHAVRGFSRIAAPALLGVFASGLFMVARTVGGLSNLFGSGYGLLLLAKVVVFVFMLRIALANRATVAKRLSRTGGLGPKAAERLRRSIGTEALAGVVVLGLTASLFSQTPEGVDVVDKKVSTKAAKPAVVPRLDGFGVDIRVGVGPAKVGLNDLTITVTRPATGLVAGELRIAGPAGDPFIIEVPLAPPLKGEGTLTILDVPFCSAGPWTVSLQKGQNTEGVMPQVQSSLEIKPGTDPLPSVCTASTSATPALPAPPANDVGVLPTAPLPTQPPG